MTYPGHNAWILIPLPSYMIASDSLRLRTNALVGPYSGLPGVGTNAAMEETLMIPPLPFAAITFNAA